MDCSPDFNVDNILFYLRPYGDCLLKMIFENKNLNIYLTADFSRPILWRICKQLNLKCEIFGNDNFKGIIDSSFYSKAEDGTRIVNLEQFFENETKFIFCGQRTHLKAYHYGDLRMPEVIEFRRSYVPSFCKWDYCCDNYLMYERFLNLIRSDFVNLWNIFNSFNQI